MSKNAQKHLPRNTAKRSNQACMLIRPFELRPRAATPPRVQCVAYITGFNINDQHFVPKTKEPLIVKRSDMLPAWKSPTLRSSHTL